MDLRVCKYSVVRYIPDQILGEIYNVGIILQCQNPFYLKFVYNTSRLKKVFKSVDLFDLDFTAKYIQELFAESRPEVKEPQTGILFGDINFLDAFSELFQDSLSISKPKTTLTTNPEKELHELIFSFAKVNTETKKRFSTRILDKFKEAGIEEKIKKFIDVDIDIVEKVQFGYQNGAANLIQPIPLSGAIQSNLEKAAFWNIAVHELREKSRKYKESPFYAIITPPKNPQKDGFETAINVLKQNFDTSNQGLLKIVNFESREMDALIEKIQLEAH